MRGVACVLVLALTAVAHAQRVSPPARDLWKEAMDYHHAKDTARALDTFLRAYHVDPSVLGLDSEGLLDRAVDHLRHQLDVSKDDPVYTFKLAEVLNLQGKLPEAIVAYRKVVAINPRSPMAQIADAEATKLEQFEKAPSPSPSPSVAEASPSPSASPSPEALSPDQQRIAELETQLKAAKDETTQVKDELDKLKDEHAKLQAEFEKAKYYKNLFFANPNNVDLLKQGTYK